MKHIEWLGTALRLLDQTKLPCEVVELRCTDWRMVAEAIKMLRVRGAPAIGVVAAYAMVLAAQEHFHKEINEETWQAWLADCQALRETRPTAINLAWAVDRMLAYATTLDKDAGIFLESLEREAVAIEEEDMQLCEAMAKAGATLFEGKSDWSIMTHCNAGALATAGIGTALGVIREVHKQGRLKMVYADETRPLLQGARLTAYELHQDGIPVTLQTDNMAAYAMQHGLIDAVIVGADRITAEGDVANKIGTYGVALLAKAHNIPFYVAAPYSTFDLSLQKGSDIPIEMRAKDEVTHVYGVQTAPLDIEVLNPAFDVTPHDLVTAIITEKGVLKPPFTSSIKAMNK